MIVASIFIYLKLQSKTVIFTQIIYEVDCPDSDKKHIGETGKRVEKTFQKT